MTGVTPPRWDAYLATILETPDGSRLVLHGRPLPAHVVTAANPYSSPRTPAENERANGCLRDDLRAEGLEHEPVVGRSPDGEWREPSFLVFGLTRDRAAALGLRFEQWAVFELDAGEVRVVACVDGAVMRTRAWSEEPAA
jgi:hypothetical protein